MKAERDLKTLIYQSWGEAQQVNNLGRRIADRRLQRFLSHLSAAVTIPKSYLRLCFYRFLKAWNTEKLGDRQLKVMSTSTHGPFTMANVPEAPEDPLYRLMREYRQDTNEKKIDLGIGAYRDEHGKPWVLPVVRKVCLRDSSTRRLRFLTEQC